MKKILLAAALFLGSRLAAQQDSSGVLLDEVIMTANRFQQKTSTTGKVVIVITRQQLERSGAKDLSQVLHEQAGIHIAGAYSNAGKDKSVFLRGAGAQYTLIMVDGIPLYDPSGIGSQFDIRNLSIGDVDRIEILKGSQSTLYGSDAVAGVIHIITKKQFDRTLDWAMLGAFGSHGTGRLNATVNGSRKMLDYRVGYNFSRTNGVSEAASADPNADKDGSHQHSGSAGLEWRPHQRLLIQPVFRFSHLAGDVDQGAFTDELDYTFREKNYHAGVRSELSMGDNKLQVIYHYNNLDREYTDDSTKSRNGFDTYSRGSYRASEHFLDFFLGSPTARKLKWAGGMDFRHSRSDQEYRSISSFPYHTRNGSDSLNHSQGSLYFAATLNTNSGFTIELGNRVHLHSEYGIVDVFNINPSVLLQKKFKLFSNLSTGYRTPSLYQLFSEFGNRDLNPETALTWEAGIQYLPNQNSFTARALIFLRRIKDVISFYTDPGTFRSEYVNQDRQRDHGAELEAGYTGKKWQLRAHYTYVDGEIRTTLGGKDTSYFNLLRRPKHSLGLHAGLKLGNAYVSSNVSWRGKRGDNYFDAQTFSVVSVTLPAYPLWDFYGEYSFWKDRLRLFVDLRNILDRDYQEIAGFNTLGFTAQAGIRLRWWEK